MMKKFFTTFLILLAIAGGYLYVNQYQKMEETVTMPMTPKEVHLDKNAKAETLNLNISEYKKDSVVIWHLHDPASEFVCYQLTFKKAGAAYDQLAGISMVLDTMLTEGTADKDAEAFQNYLLNHQIQFSPSHDDDNFYLTVRTTKQKFDQSFDLVREVLGSLRLASDDMNRMKRELVMNLEQSRFDPDSKAADTLSQYAFKKHPYHVSLDDTLAGVKQVSETLLRHKMKQFAYDQLSTVFCGNISQSEIEDFVVSLKAVLPESAEEIQLENVVYDHQGKTHYEHMDVPQSAIRFVMPGAPRLAPDYYAVMMMNAILGGTAFDSRLWNDVREKNGLAYSVGTQLSASRYMNNLKGSLGTSREKADKAIDLVKLNVKRLKEEGITEEELAFQKQYQTGKITLAFDSMLGTTRTLGSMQAQGLSPNLVNQWPEIINKLTVEDVNAVAKKYLDLDKLTFVAVGRYDDNNART